MMTWQERIDNYEKEMTNTPKHLFIGGDGKCYGIMRMGQNYTVKSKYYGGYPHGYLKRIKALFPEKQKTLHLFSGEVDLNLFPGDTVDINPNNNPTYVDNAQTLLLTPLEKYDLILSDPPYSVEDSQHYGTSMVKRNTVMRALQRCSSGCHIVWLDQVLPMYRKDFFEEEAFIGMVKSTNHRFRNIIVWRKI